MSSANFPPHRSASINLDVQGGTSIEEAIDLAVAVSRKVGVMIRFQFNGVTVLAGFDSDKKALADSVMKKMGGDDGIKIASAWKPNVKYPIGA